MLVDQQKKHHQLDHLGIGMSLLCAVHCSVLPIILTLTPLVGLKFLTNNYVEIAIIVSSLMLACFSLAKSYRVHSNKWPLIRVCVGFSSIALGHFFAGPNIEWIFLTFGGLIIASAHWRNWKLNQTCWV